MSRLLWSSVLNKQFKPQQYEMKFLRAKNLKLLFRFWPPYWGAGVRIHRISNDYRLVVTSLKLRWYNSNYVGTHYGGNLFTMTDPFYMIMLLKNLADDYLVWDQSSKITYVKPGTTTAFAKFELTEEQLREIARKAADGLPYYWDVDVNVCDTSGETVAKVEKTIYIRKKKGR